MNGEHSLLPLSPPRSSALASAASLGQMIAMHNPIQLAAISNYKLAQLTFAAPDLHSLRKTALVKNMLEVLYRETPSDWLDDQMTRWVFLTPESLSDMTQERLEEIFAQYALTIEAFQPLDMDDTEADRIWEDHYMWGASDGDDIAEEEFRNTSGSTVSEASTIFSQPQAAMSSEAISNSRPALPPSPPVSLVDKPLPKNPPPSDDIPRRKSLTTTARSRNRLSWTSDTGVALPSSAVQNMASDLMNLFDMDFSVDIKLNTAPKLPELPFPRNDPQKRKRLSNDSLMGLIPTFETFTLDDDPPHSSLSQKPKRKSRLSQSWSRPFSEMPSTSTSYADYDYHTISSPPARSSSLAYREQQRLSQLASQHLPNNKATGSSKRSDFLAAFWGSAINGSGKASHNDKKETRTLSRSKSMRRLASLVKGNKKKASRSSPTLPSFDDDQESLAPPELPEKDHLFNRSEQSLCSIASKDRKQVSRSSPSLSSFEGKQESLAPPPLPVKDHLFNRSEQSLCSIASTVSSCSTCTAEVMVARKASFLKPRQQQSGSALTDSNNEHILAKRRSFTMLRPVVVEAQELRRARSVGHRHSPPRRHLASKMEGQKDVQQVVMDEPRELQEQPSLSRSKSALRKLGRGLSQRRRKQENLRWSADQGTSTRKLSVQEVTVDKNTNTLVKRMASLGRRIRL